LSLKTTRGDFFNLSYDLLLVSEVSLVFSLLLCLLNFEEQLLVGLVHIVYVLLVEVLLFVVEAMIDWLCESSGVSLKAILKRDRILGVEAVKSKLRVLSLQVIGSFGELDLNILVGDCVVHRKWVVNISAVYHVFYKAMLLVRSKPLVLLLHNLMEGVSEVAILLVYLNLLVQSGVQLHDRVVLLLSQVLQLANRAQVVPVLWIVFQKPSIVVLGVHSWVLQEIGHLARALYSFSAVITLADSDVSCEEVFNHACLIHLFLLLISLLVRLVLAKVEKWALIDSLCFKRIKVGHLSVVRNVFPIIHIIVVGCLFVSPCKLRQFGVCNLKLGLVRIGVARMLCRVALLRSCWLGVRVLLFNEGLHLNLNL